MSKLNIYIVEDDELYADQLMILIDELGYNLVGMSSNSDIAQKEIRQKMPDLLLVDIGIEGSMDGIELIQSLQGEISAPVIFITAFKDKSTFKRSKLVNPYAYLSKPFDAENLERTIELAFQSIEEHSLANDWEQDISYNDSFFIKTGNRLRKVAISEIMYLEVDDRHSTLYSSDGQKYVVRMSLGELNNKLPSNDFIRVHRKYMVNKNKITSVDLQEQVLFLNEFQIAVSRTGKEELLNRLNWLQ